MKRFTLLLIVALVATTNICSAQSKKDNAAQVDRILTLFHEERVDEGEFVVDSMRRLYPQNSDMLHLKALCHDNRDEFQKALACYDYAIENVSRKSYYGNDFLHLCRVMLRLHYESDYDAAIEDLTQVLELADKRNLWVAERALDLRADCYYYRGDYHMAERDLMALLLSEDEENFERAACKLCDLYITTENYEKATSVANNLLEMHRCHNKAYYTLAYTNIKTDNVQLGIRYAVVASIVDVEQEYADDLRSILWRDVELARSLLRDYVNDGVANGGVYQLLYAAELLNDYDTVFSLLDVIEDDHDKNQMLYWRAKYSGKMGNYDDAIRYITELISRDDDAESVLQLTSQRCGYYYSAGKYEEVIREAESLMEQYPDYAYGYYVYGYCHERMGDDAKAMEYYNKYLERNDSTDYIYFKRGRLYLKAGDKDSAKRDFERVLELEAEGDSSFCLFALHFLGRNEEAIQVLNTIVENAPYDPNSYYDAACLYALMGDIYQSLDNLRIALYLGYKSKAIIEHDDDLDPIRHTEAYKALMNEYFN